MRPKIATCYRGVSSGWRCLSVNRFTLTLFYNHSLNTYRQSDDMALKFQMPREHGLVVVWLNVFLISIFVSKTYSLYGIVTIILLSLTFIIYDPLISMMRVQKARRNALHYLFHEYAYVPAIVLLIAGWLLFEVLYRKLNVYAILIALAVFIVLYLLFPMGERKAYTRGVSIISVTSFFLIIVSSFTAALNSVEILLFITLSLIEVMLGMGPVEIVNTKIEKKNFTGIFLRRMVPVYMVSMAILIVISIYVTGYWWIFIIIYTVFFLSFPFIRTWRMKNIGMIATVFNIVVLVCISLLFFRSV